MYKEYDFVKDSVDGSLGIIAYSSDRIGANFYAILWFEDDLSDAQSVITHSKSINGLASAICLINAATNMKCGKSAASFRHDSDLISPSDEDIVLFKMTMI